MNIPFVYLFLGGLGLLVVGFTTGAIIFAGENRNKSLAMQAEIRARSESYQYYLTRPAVLSSTTEREREWMVRQNTFVLLQNEKAKRKQNRKSLLGRA